ncbi:MAG: RNA polymerase sigma factor, partial [Planctomycetia bacterium]
MQSTDESANGEAGDGDADLLRRTASGDAAAFAEFYRRHAPAAFGLIFRIIKDRAAAEDVL